MKTPIFVSILCLLALTVELPAGVPTANPARNFSVEKLADGVFAFVRRDPPGLMVDANSVLIVNADDAIVIDTSGATTTSRAVLAEIRKLTRNPVRYVVNTHWHDDHIRGNSVFRDAFPGVEFVGHARLREYLPTTGEKNRASFLKGAPPVVAQLRDLLAKNKNFNGGELSAEERESFTSDIALVELALKDAPTAPTILPTITVRDRLTLHRGDRTIEILHLGAGHTAGDLVVHLPKEGIVVTGDLIVRPVPLVGSDQSHIRDWSATLERLRALRARTIVPGHGPVMHDDAYLATLADLFTAIADRTKEAAARGDSIEQARKSVKLDDFRQRLAGESPVRKLLFDQYVAYPGISAAFREATK